MMNVSEPMGSLARLAAAALGENEAALTKLRLMLLGVLHRDGTVEASKVGMLDAQSALRALEAKRAVAARALSALVDEMGRVPRDAELEAAMNRALYASMLVRVGGLMPVELEAEAAWLSDAFRIQSVSEAT